MQSLVNLMSFFKILLKIISFCLYLILFLFFILLVAPRLFGFMPLTVVSGSMIPKFAVGTIIYYKEVPIDRLKEGDIIVYQLNGNNVTHRIKEITDKGFITKGDANNTADPMVVRDFQIEGKVMNFSIPELGKYLYYFYTDQILIIIVFAFLIFDFLVDIFSHSKSKQKKKQIEIKEREEIEII